MCNWCVQVVSDGVWDDVSVECCWNCRWICRLCSHCQRSPHWSVLLRFMHLCIITKHLLRILICLPLRMGFSRVPVIYFVIHSFTLYYCNFRFLFNEPFWGSCTTLGQSIDHCSSRTICWLDYSKQHQGDTVATLELRLPISSIVKI